MHMSVAYLHREFRAVHRDTKPGNVLPGAQRRHGYLSDFGSAATVDANDHAHAARPRDEHLPASRGSCGRSHAGTIREMARAARQGGSLYLAIVYPFSTAQDDDTVHTGQSRVSDPYQQALAVRAWLDVQLPC
jgi:serine/threonine protein kinase